MIREDAENNCTLCCTPKRPVACITPDCPGLVGCACRGRARDLAEMRKHGGTCGKCRAAKPQQMPARGVNARVNGDIES